MRSQAGPAERVALPRHDGLLPEGVPSGQSMPRISFFVTRLGRGGAETQVLRVACSLKQRGWHVEVISILSPTGYVEELRDSNIPFHSFNIDRRSRFTSGPGVVWRLARLLRQTRPHVLAAFSHHANLLGTIVGRAAGVPVICTSIRGMSIGGRFREAIEYLVGRLAPQNVVTANSKNVAESFITRGIIAHDRMRVIPNGIDVSAFMSPPPSVTTTIGKRLGARCEQFQWLAVGNVRAVKDYPTLLHAFLTVIDQRPNAILRIAGAARPEDVLVQEIRTLIVSLGLSEHVELLGSREDIADLLHGADALVLASCSEGLPNAIMEAFATGTPVVATAVGGVPELVMHGVSGFLCPPGSPSRLAEEMLNMMDQPVSDRRSMGTAGQAHVTKYFDSETVVTMWEQLFLDELQRSPTSVTWLDRGS
jgi:glycosyltransferase involved in cell wall biosynthesis